MPKPAIKANMSPSVWPYLMPLLFVSRTTPSYIDRFNRTYCEKLLDWYVFETLGEVRRMTSKWMPCYTEIHPHESLGDLPPRQHLMAKSPQP